MQRRIICVREYRRSCTDQLARGRTTVLKVVPRREVGVFLDAKAEVPANLRVERNAHFCLFRRSFQVVAVDAAGCTVGCAAGSFTG